MIAKSSVAGELKDQVPSTVAIVFAILIFGSLWGLVEIALGGALRLVSFPYRAGVLTGVGMGMITGMALAIYRKPAMAFGIGIVAALTKLMVVPIQRVPLTCPANSCIAVVLEAIALGAVAFALIKAMDGNPYSQIITGASAAFAGSMLFWVAGMHVAPCRYLLSFAGTPGAWMIKEGLVWAAFSGILFPMGYLTGVKLRPGVAYILTERPNLACAGSIAVLVICLTLSAVSLGAGL